MNVGLYYLLTHQKLKKNIAGQVLTYNSKNFHWLNRKLDLERTMNVLQKPIRKKSNPNNWKSSKIQIEIAACEQKTTSKKANFCPQTLFSHSNLKLEQKTFTPQNHSLFRSTSCFGVNKIITSIWLQKTWKCVNRAGRIPETTRRRKLPILMTKQLQQLLWNLNLHKCHKKFEE